MRALILLLAPLGFAAEFEAASIKPAPLQPIGRTSVRMSSNTTAGTLTFLNVNIRDLIAQAYRVTQDRISGPDWMNDARFDIAATFTAGATLGEFREMLQSLLAERFSVKLHRETREMPLYDLVVGKGGPKLKPADASGRTSSTGNNGVIHLEAKIAMAGFAEYLGGRTDRPVADKTGLTGPFEISLDFATEENPEVASLFTALQEQLGLKLEPSKGPVEFLVVDSASRTPTEN